MTIPVRCAHTEMRATDSLRPNPANPNRHGNDQIELFCKVVTHLGWRRPITVSKRSGLVVKGHGQLEVAKRLGVQEVPVDLHDYQTEDEEWQDLLADNRIGELSEREDSEVAKLLQELQALGTQIEFTGYDPRALTTLLTRLSRDNPEQDAEPQETSDALAKEMGVLPGQIWAMGNHRLAVGDCTDAPTVERLMAYRNPGTPEPRNPI